MAGVPPRIMYSSGARPPKIRFRLGNPDPAVGQPLTMQNVEVP